MSEGKRRAVRAFSKLDVRKKNKVIHIPGVLGIPIGGTKTVEVPGREGYVYVRLRNSTSELVQVYNDQVSPVYGLPVLIKKDDLDPTRYVVAGRDLGVYQNWGNSPYLPRHGNTHRFWDGGGGDIVFVEDRQLMPMLVHPSGTSGACNVVIEPDVYYQDGQWKYGGNTGSPDLCSLKPTDNSAKMVLLYLDSNTNPQLVDGTTFDATLTGTAQVLPFVPALPSTSAVPLAWIRLVSGTERVGWTNIYDARPWIVGDGVLTTGTSRHIIQDEGVSEVDRPFLNFVGSTVFVVDEAGSNRTDVIISGSSDSGHTIQNEGTPVTQRTNLNFIGSTVFVEDEPGNDRTNIIVSGSSGGGGGADFASKSEAEIGVITDKVISPATLPIIMPDGGLLRTDEITTGDARGDGAVDLQRDRASADQVASGADSVIGGGQNNLNNSTLSTIGGGEGHRIFGSSYNTISGGRNNIVSGSSSSMILGGGFNEIGDADNAAIIGGSVSKVTADGGIASGNNSLAYLPYMEARAESQIGSGRQQRIQLLWNTSTTTATPKEVKIAAVHRAALPNNTTWLFEIWLVAHNITTNNEGAGYKFLGVINRQGTAASTALIGSVTKTVVAETVAGWDADVDADTTNGSLRITVTGENSKTIVWFAHGILSQSQ